MANNSTQRAVTTVDPMFSIPEGVDELQYGKINPANAPGLDGDNATGETRELNVADVELIYSDIQFIEVPEISGIDTQTLRRSKGGGNVVDLIVDIVGDGIGVSQYEFRVTKLD
jgi:hypothetical protein